MLCIKLLNISKQATLFGGVAKERTYFRQEWKLCRSLLHFNQTENETKEQFKKRANINVGNK